MAAACELASGIVQDHDVPAGAIKAFSTLGSEGKHLQNCERDLHTWLKALYGFELETYVVQIPLQIHNQKVQQVPIGVLLPHELIHAVATMPSKSFFESVFLGNLDDSERNSWWLHVQSLPPWSRHPCLNNNDCNLRRLIGLTIHGDGAVMKRDDECFVWSVSSIFSQEGMINDPLHVKFPVALIPERHMLSKEVPRMNMFIYILFHCLEPTVSIRVFP